MLKSPLPLLLGLTPQGKSTWRRCPLCFPRGAAGWSGLKAGKNHSHLRTHQQLLYLPQGGVCPLPLFLSGEEFLLYNYLPRRNKARPPEPSAFQPGRKRLLRAFPGGNKSIQHFVKLWQFLKRIFCLRSRRFVVVCFVRLPPAFLPSSKRRRKAKSKRICHNTSLEQGTTRLKSFLASETVQG